MKTYTIYKDGSLLTDKATSADLWNHMFGFIKNTSYLHQRLSELRDRGVIREVCERPCSITGRNAIVWDVTANVPTPMPKKKTKDQIIKELQEQVERLKSEIVELRRHQYISDRQQLLFK